MVILILILAVLFGFSHPTAYLAPAATQVSMEEPVPFEIDGQPVTGIAVEPVTGEARYAAVTSALYRTDGAGDWQPSGTSMNLASMIVDTRSPDVIWGGTGQECYRGGGEAVPLMKSVDGGATWTESGRTGLVPLASWVDTGTVIAHDCSGLQVTRDGGATWVMPEGLPLGSQVTAFTVGSSPESAAGLTLLVGVTGEGGTSELYRVNLSDPDAMAVDGPLQTYFGFGSVAVEDEGAILLAAPQGVLRSEDRGETWTVLRDGLESTTLEQDPIEFFPPDLEPGSFGLPAIITVGEPAYVAGVDGVYQRAGDDQAWAKVTELDIEVASMAVEPGTTALLLQTAEGKVLRIETS